MPENLSSFEPLSEPGNQPARNFRFSSETLFFLPKGDLPILRPEDLKFTQQDYDQGWSPNDKTAETLNRLLNNFIGQLRQSENFSPSLTNQFLIETLQCGEPIFLAVDTPKTTDEFQASVRAFPGTTPGVILYPENAKHVVYLPAIQSFDGRIARIITTSWKKDQDLSHYTERLNFIAPPTHAQTFTKQSELNATFAIEFVTDGLRPRVITQEMIDDWLDRVENSGLLISFDVSQQDDSLDNFILRGGKLWWVDGDIIGAKIASSAELEASLAMQRATLEHFIPSAISISDIDA